ncbi:RTA1 like protein-domain-containing protein [Dactylonectria estremocensis]|uniref:RTA1 like protein-domain-containing protein n=1 Tax=Dactylonectria estremocensis TaxID=1079267 RepID=A0A9P9DQB4_9HYPO|nr:RTA1 like protein-domain-containing protein [Dactylonectria estremocensis]
MSSSNSTNTTKGYAPFDLYPYNPAQPPAFAFLVLFAGAALVHFILMFPYRSAFPIPMIIGAGMESSAYWFRTRSHDNLRQTLPFLIQNLLVLVAPPFLAATLYMSLGRITRALKAEDLSLISVRWLTKMFVLVDVICFATQTAGAIMSGSEVADEASRGKMIIIIGLGLQIAAFALFMMCILAIQKRIASSPKASAVAGELSYRRYLFGLQITSVLFLVRNIVRIVEYNQGSDGPLLSSEVWLYVFDACFMLAIIVVLIFLHPGRLIKKTRYQKQNESDILLA